MFSRLFKTKKRIAEEKKSFLQTLKEGRRPKTRKIAKFMGSVRNGAGPPG